MNIEEYHSYCLSKKGVTASFPFPKLPHILVFKVLGKMFTATDVNDFTSFSIKANPDEIEELRAQYPCLSTQAYMHKKHWNNVLLDNSVGDGLLYQWIDISYKLVVQQLTKKQERELNSL
jgi:predicted DNA-binding protein (MmcQ/YjbR family)